MKNYLLLLALSVPLVFSACKKDDEEATPAQTTSPIDALTAGTSDPAAMNLTSELITAPKWKLTDLYQANPNTLAYKNLYSQITACQKDNLYQFNAAGNSLTITDGLYYCNTNPVTQTGSWSLKNSANLNLDIPGITQTGLTGEFNIVQLSESEMVLKQVVGGFVYVAVYQKYVSTNADLLMNKNWRLVAETEQLNGNTPTDLYATYPICQKDDFIRFEGNGQLIYDQGATKCSSSAPQTTSENYSFNGYSIIKSPQGTQQYINVQELTTSRLILRTAFNNSQGYYVNRVSTYIAF